MIEHFDDAPPTPFRAAPGSAADAELTYVPLPGSGREVTRTREDD